MLKFYIAVFLLTRFGKKRAVVPLEEKKGEEGKSLTESLARGDGRKEDGGRRRKRGGGNERVGKTERAGGVETKESPEEGRDKEGANLCGGGATVLESHSYAVAVAMLRHPVN